MVESTYEYLSSDTKEYFNLYCMRENFSAGTRKKYFLWIKNICDVFEKDFLYLTEEDVDRYEKFLREKIREGGLSKKTLRTRFYAYISFARYLVEIGELENSPFSCVVLPDVDDAPHSLKIPSLEDVDKVLSAAEKDTGITLILLLVLRMGLTVAEICGLKATDLVSFDEKLYFSFLSEKGEARYMEIPSDLTKRVTDYAEMNPSTYLFVNRNGKQMKERTLEMRIRKIVDKSGCSPFTLRDLRNRCIFQMLHDGVEMEDVAKYNNLSMRRVRTFAEAPFVKSQALSVCPANVSRIRIVEE